MENYHTIKSTIDEKLQSGKLKGDLLADLGDLPSILKRLPDEIQRKQVLRETVLAAYWGKKASEFTDKDVYSALMMIRITHKQYEPKEEFANLTKSKGLLTKISESYKNKILTKITNYVEKMKAKDQHFRGRIERWIWKQTIEHDIQSLGYEINPDKCFTNFDYVSKEGVPVKLNNSLYVPACSVEIGDRKDLERIKQEGNLEDAIKCLVELNDTEDFNTDQMEFGKEKNGQEIWTGRSVLSRKLSRSPFIATIEFKELHDVYTNFRKKYLFNG